MFDLISLKRRIFNRRPELRIRLAKNADIFEILGLLKETREANHSSLDLKKKDQDLLNIKHYYQNGIFLVAEEDGKIVALSAMLIDNQNVSHISKLLVSKHYRRMGLGRELLDMMKNHAISKNSQQIMMSFPKSLRSGHKLVTHYGFEALDLAIPETKHSIKKYILDFRH